MRRSGINERAVPRFHSPYRCRDCGTKFWVLSRRTWMGTLAFGALIVAVGATWIAISKYSTPNAIALRSTLMGTGEVVIDRSPPASSALPAAPSAQFEGGQMNDASLDVPLSVDAAQNQPLMNLGPVEPQKK